MKRVLRILHWFLVIFCFLLFIATTILWTRSQTNVDEIAYYRPQRYIGFESVRGRLIFNYWTAPSPYWSDGGIKFSGGDLSRFYDRPRPFYWQLGHFGYTHAAPNGPVFATPATGDIFMFPHWSLLLISAILPSFSLRRFLKTRRGRLRAQKGLCPQCGYDLRFNPNRCPECGLEKAFAPSPSS